MAVIHIILCDVKQKVISTRMLLFTQRWKLTKEDGHRNIPLVEQRGTCKVSATSLRISKCCV